MRQLLLAREWNMFLLISFWVLEKCGGTNDIISPTFKVGSMSHSPVPHQLTSMPKVYSRSHPNLWLVTVFDWQKARKIRTVSPNGKCIYCYKVPWFFTLSHYEKSMTLSIQLKKFGIKIHIVHALKEVTLSLQHFIQSGIQILYIILIGQWHIQISYWKYSSMVLKCQWFSDNKMG